MARRQLIRMSVYKFLQEYYDRLACNGWYDENRFILEIIERPKILRTMYVLQLSDNSEVVVDGSTLVDVELY